jgi:predicted ester cyclase
MDMVRIQDDKIIEHWALNDQTSLKRQLNLDD